MKYFTSLMLAASVFGSGFAVAEDSYALVNKSTQFVYYEYYNCNDNVYDNKWRQTFVPACSTVYDANNPELSPTCKAHIIVVPATMVKEDGSTTESVSATVNASKEVDGVEVDGTVQAGVTNTTNWAASANWENRAGAANRLETIYANPERAYNYNGASQNMTPYFYGNSCN